MYKYSECSIYKLNHLLIRISLIYNNHSYRESLLFRLFIMYVCLCHGITDKQIRKAVQGGCGSMCDLRCKTSVGNQCGKCNKTAKKIFQQAIEQDTSVIATFK